MDNSFGSCVLRTGCVISGLVIGYVALFMREDEEEKLQDQIDLLWCNLFQVSDAATRRHVAFLQGSASAALTYLERLFGIRILTPQAIGVAFCLSTGTCHLIQAVGRYFVGIFEPLDAFFLVTGLVLVGLAFLPLYLPKLRRLIGPVGIVSWIVLSAVTRFSVGGFTTPWSWEREGLATGVFLFAILLAMPFLLLSVFFTKWLLRQIATMTSTFRIMFAVLTNLLLILILTFLLPSFLTPSGNPDDYPPDSLESVYGTFAAFFAMANLALWFPASIYVLLIATLLIHRMFWPFLHRPLYALARLGINGRQKLFIPVAGALLAVGLPIVNDSLQIIAKSLIG